MASANAGGFGSTEMKSLENVQICFRLEKYWEPFDKSTGLPRDVERADGPAWRGASSGTRHRPVLTRGITNAVVHQDRHAGDLGIPSNHQAATPPPPTSPTGSQQSRSTKPTPTPPPTSTALDNASRSPRPTPPTALNVINIINATQLRWTPPTPTPSCSGRCHAVAFAITAVTATEPWGGFGGDDGQMPNLMQSRHR
ncbi:hypothetical protein DFH09DRAFT_1487458 [Mycena vulgaris]|nr:hypothetical protein DFH09DRAFT_1487458 [Mycena vulgaris]